MYPGNGLVIASALKKSDNNINFKTFSGAFS